MTNPAPSPPPTTNTTYPTTLSSLHFPSTTHQTISQVLSSLRKSTLSITNRLRSIEEDARFVQQVANHYRLPLVANERCGSWYIPPERKREGGSAYFKSTDGHAGQWDFTMPDALSKTVPIWAAVMNRTLFPEAEDYHAVQFPPDLLGKSEESQIEKRIGGFVLALKSLTLPLPSLKSQLKKPIRLVWATRDSFHPNSDPNSNPHHPNHNHNPNHNLIILCSASRRVHGAEMSEGGYIQGAGDDSEAWACGLTPELFWEHREELFKRREEELAGFIEGLVERERCGLREVRGERVLVKPTGNVWVVRGGGGGGGDEEVELRIDCNGAVGDGDEGEVGSRDTASSSPEEGDSKILNLACPTGKLGSRHLRKVLEKVEQFVSTHLSRDPSQSLVVMCENGKDLSVGTVLMIICLFYDEEGNYTGPQRDISINKEYIRRRLAWIISSKDDANPSRATLQSVNSYLMERPDRDY
ncbi:hypothetical protein FQN50_005160 [Emmonsiellopsis sp. PD_5]|nr:hypothetical protein FQN50_005160 [Emmonsiellopsis sp. PD_5]